MKALGLGLGAVFAGGGGGGVSVTRTAFVASYGSDGSGVLNNENLPYVTLEAAMSALASEDSTAATVVFLDAPVLVQDLATDHSFLLLNGLTLKARGGVYSLLDGEICIGAAPDVILHIEGLTTFTLYKPPHLGANVENAATITGDAHTSFHLVCTGELNPPPAGDDAADGGSNLVGSPNFFPGDKPAPNSPPVGGANGGDLTVTGNAGEGGQEGARAWDAVVLGDCSLSVIAVGGPGGDGQGGGQGGSFTEGGRGQDGGDSSSTEPEDGGPGGNGGSVNARGGEGGIGGRGGDGGNIYIGVGVTVTYFDLVGGLSGVGGPGGFGGTGNTGGEGGLGGGGGGGGSYGAPGATGSVTETSGADGGPGEGGNTGSVLPVPLGPM